MARNTDMMVDGGGLQSFRSAEAADKLATDVVATLSKPSVPEDIALAAKAGSAPSVGTSPASTSSRVNTNTIQGIMAASAATTPTPTAVVTPVFASTGDVFKDTLNNLRAARGITPTDINALGQLNVQDLTEQRIADAQAVAAKPVMSAEQKAGGGQVKWVGGINGEYQIIMPIGSPLVGSKAAGWEPGRNNLAGVPTATTGATGGTGGATGGATGGTGTGATGGTGTGATGGTGTGTGTGTGATGTGFNTTGLTTEQIDAVAGIKAFLSSLGIGDLSDAITNAIKRGYTTDTIKLIMQDPASKDPLAVAFQKRFPANKERLAAGKPAIDAADYLRAERAYAQIFQSYGVSNLATNDLMSSFIAGDVSATEVTDRIALAVNRVQNADANTKAILKRNYPELTTGDIVGAMLNPKDGLPALQRKVQIAEIGGAALAQKLDTSLAGGTKASDVFGNVTTGSMGLEELASLGITKEEAQKGYGQVASIAPRSEFLSSITGGEDYTRLQAEQEVFGGLASAKRAREQLSETEVGRFSGKAGNIGSKSFGQSRTI
jgi:hypothetical protein